MAMRKTSNALVVQPNVSPSKWLNRNNRGSSHVKVASSVLSKYDPAKWLLTHVTIMASVDLEEAVPGDKKSAYLIKPEHNIFVNNNGDCWERELLAKTYKTFIGANNYVEHVQLPEHSKGKVVDAALREVDLGIDGDGNKCSTLYVDLLIATSWNYPDICSKILSGEYCAVSMGCTIQYSQCSRCGNIAKDEADHCEHIKYFRRNTFYDDNGKKRIVAEICGSADDPSSVVFIDASWVRRPAFPGAVLRNVVSPEDTARLRAVALGKSKTDPLMDHVKAAEIMNTEHHDTSAFNKAASAKKADDPEAPRFGEPEEADKPTEDKSEDDAFPAPEAGGGAPADDADGGGFGDDSADGAAAEESGTTPEDADSTPFDSIKKEIHDGILTQIKQQLMDQVKDKLKDKDPAEEATNADTAEQSIFRQTDSIVKEASSPKTLKYLKEKYSIDICSIQNVKLASSLMAVASSKNLKDIKKLGFTRKDAALVLNFVDTRKTGCPVGNDVVKYITDNPAVSSQDSVLDFILQSARRPSDHEKRVLRQWPDMLRGM